MKIAGSLPSSTLSTPLAGALVRLDLLSRGEADPVAVRREERELQEQMDALDAWEAATPGGSGYTGERGVAPYGPPVDRRRRRPHGMMPDPARGPR